MDYAGEGADDPGREAAGRCGPVAGTEPGQSCREARRKSREARCCFARQWLWPVLMMVSMCHGLVTMTEATSTEPRAEGTGQAPKPSSSHDLALENFGLIPRFSFSFFLDGAVGVPGLPLQRRCRTEGRG